MKSEQKLPSAIPLYAIFAVSPFVIGIYYEWLSCAVSILLIAYLLYCAIKTGKIAIPVTPLMAACTIIALFFAISIPWAVDRGMTVFGTVKFLPLPLYCAALSQIEAERRKSLLMTVPLSGAVMTVSSFALGFVPGLSRYFLVSGRLSGFFQYSNTFAEYLFIGLLITVLGYKKLRYQAPLCALLLFGILMSGSRTVFILLALCVFPAVLFLKNKKAKIILLSVFAVLTFSAGAFAVITGKLDTIGRFLTSSFDSSTFLGRILYYKDALPIILKHPFGLGYMGYYFLQDSFKTGVYTVVNIHNDFLQLLLDIGWIPFAVSVWAIIRAFKNNSPVSKAVIAAISAHCLLDFDLQYISVCFVLITAMNDDFEKSFFVRSKSATAIFCALCTAFCFYFGTASGLYYYNEYGLASSIYPAYTSAYIEEILRAESIDEMDMLANEIMKYNESVPIAYSIKGRAAFARGDVNNTIKYMRQAIFLSKYRIDEYRDYRDMLKYAIAAYENSGDTQSADYCRKYLEEIYATLKRVEQETSPLAWKISVKPILELD